MTHVSKTLHHLIALFSAFLLAIACVCVFAHVAHASIDEPSAQAEPIAQKAEDAVSDIEVNTDDMDAQIADVQTADEDGGQAGMSEATVAAPVAAADTVEQESEPVVEQQAVTEAAVIVVPQPAPAPVLSSSNLTAAASSATTVNTKIMGTSTTTVAQMVNFYNSKGRTYPSSVLGRGGASTIAEFCTILYEQAKLEGVRAEVVFVQAMYETGWLQYGGDVKSKQFNFAGLGATGGGVTGASFANVAQGLLAQVQHLKAYASTAPLNTPLVDPRFGLVTRGCATTVEALAGKWAVPGYGYGTSLRDLLQALSLTTKSASAGTSAVPPVADGVYAITPAHATSKRLVVSGNSTADGAKVVIFQGNGTKEQQWSFSYDRATGTYAITSVATGKQLAIKGSKVKNLVSVVQRNASSALTHRWIISKQGSGFTIAPALKSYAYTIDISGSATANNTNAILWKRTKAANQTFTFSGVNAYVPPIAKGKYFIVTSMVSNKIVEVAGSSKSENANVQLCAISGDANQKWSLLPDSATNSYKFKNNKSGKYLSVASMSAANRVNVVQQAWTGANNQRWRIVKNSDGTYTITSMLNNGYVLDIEGFSTADGTNALLWTNAGGSNQKFKFVKASSRERTVADGTYILSPSHAKKKALHVKGSSKKSGANVFIYTNKSKDCQKWSVIFDPWKGYYTIRSVVSGKMLDVQNGKKVSGTNIRQWDANDAKAQRWLITKNANNTYTIGSALSSTLALGVAGSAKTNRTNVELQTKADVASQKIVFRTTTAVGKLKIYLDAGHGQGSSYVGRYDSGAIGCGYEEAKLTAELVNLTAKYAQSLYGVSVVTNVNANVPFPNRQADAKSKGCNAFVSIHFNSYNGGATGTESYRHSKYAASGSSTLQSIMHKHLVKGVGLADRGMKTAELSVCNGSSTGIPATLLEVCFIDNSYDMKTYNANKDRIARELALGLFEASLSGI